MDFDVKGEEMLPQLSRRDFLAKTILLSAGITALSCLSGNAHAVSPMQRKFGSRMRLSCTAYSYRKYLEEENPPSMTMEDFLDECARMGLGAAEPTSYYFPEPLTEEYLLRYKRKAFLLGLDLSDLGIRNTFTYPPGPEREKNLQHVNQWVDHAAILGIPSLRIFAGDAPQGVSQNQAIQWCIETTEEACRYSGKRGIFLAMENHWGIVPDAKSLLRIVHGVKSDWFGVSLDTGNFSAQDPYAEMARVAPYAVNVQIKVEVSTPGRGKAKADFERIIGLLGEAGYRGYVALDYESTQEPKEDIPRHIERLQRILSHT